MRRRTLRGPVAGAAVVALAALVVAPLVGCGTGEPAEKSSPATVEVTPTAASGTTVDARVGDTVIVSLDANATTGYEWTFTPGDTFTIENSEYVPDPNPEGLAGSGGTQIVTLKVTKTGASDLVGAYARSWETPSPGARQSMKMTVTSTE